MVVSSSDGNPTLRKQLTQSSRDRRVGAVLLEHGDELVHVPRTGDIEQVAHFGPHQEPHARELISGRGQAEGLMSVVRGRIASR